MDLILGVLENAVAEHVPCLHGVGAGRAGVEQAGDLICAPRPEALCREVGGNGQIDAHLRISAGEQHGSTILPSLRIAADGII